MNRCILSNVYLLLDVVSIFVIWKAGTQSSIQNYPQRHDEICPRAARRNYKHAQTGRNISHRVETCRLADI